MRASPLSPLAHVRSAPNRPRSRETAVTGLYYLFLFPTAPATAWFLTERERIMSVSSTLSSERIIVADRCLARLPLFAARSNA
jgi:hypothetical protein